MYKYNFYLKIKFTTFFLTTFFVLFFTSTGHALSTYNSWVNAEIAIQGDGDGVIVYEEFIDPWSDGWVIPDGSAGSFASGESCVGLGGCGGSGGARTFSGFAQTSGQASGSASGLVEVESFGQANGVVGLFNSSDNSVDISFSVSWNWAMEVTNNDSVLEYATTNVYLDLLAYNSYESLDSFDFEVEEYFVEKYLATSLNDSMSGSGSSSTFSHTIGSGEFLYLNTFLSVVGYAQSEAAAQVPEPATITLFGIGLMGLALCIYLNGKKNYQACNYQIIKERLI